MKQTGRQAGLLFFALTLVCGLSACATLPGPEALAQAGAERLGAARVRQHVTGKTEEWVHGGAWYSADGRLQVRWRKAHLKGSWEVSDDGLLCYQLPRWQRQCHYYMELDGEILMIDEGRNIGVRRMHDGNRLAKLGSYQQAVGRKR